ncbi:MAG: HAD-IIIA family hydrolase [Candidatus Kapabacteria bacterium]|jgi:histidinol-phosphate phosphatase family protein|nr:HAD-IIIA family hydrolase [Candidatus Kapabacteria bacterium]
MNSTGKRKYICFDRDGVVNMRIVSEYVITFDQFLFLPDFLICFKKLMNAGYRSVLVTNQQGIGKGIMTDKEFLDLSDKMQEELKEKTGFNFDKVYYCPDLADSGSMRRKPNPGMLTEAIEDFNIDKDVSWMVGDSVKDATAGKRAGLNTALVGEFAADDTSDTDHIFGNLLDLTEYFKKEKFI